ncbi:hypothetical protein SAMN05216338_105066 [Bradyrhizobium sp. Rc2d]|uniref:hypothetical protein n=1 Tax=Bradyrhizobium sp. Rc2d TaxID=1855321 RepID=UPI00088B81D5|nr:hypothetical protein [Bradyrhizobium sp. Rc2d]SDJ47208.1 hypothetical protein SAMN05216338_105066 [Bradyrhizobium sp. Rc2d]
MEQPDYEAHARIREMAAIGLADLWLECETAFGRQSPAAAAIFGRILDKLTNTAIAKGLSSEDLVAELDATLTDARENP